MTPIKELTSFVTSKKHLVTLQEYRDFALEFLDFLEQGLQATIICQNEHNYKFFQFREDCDYNISRPVNEDLFGSRSTFEDDYRRFENALEKINGKKSGSKADRAVFNSIVYTLQQCIAVALDALPASSANQAKKRNGDLFERLIRLLIREVGVECDAGVLHVPISDDHGVVLHTMNYQHDLIGKKDGEIVFLGSVKTSSKDRLDKIFVDKLLYTKFTNSDTPYIAVFLNDVQRAKSKTFGKQRINSTFLSGHFKAYTLKLTSLDGVYYCDLRPQMKNDPFLSSHISSVDRLFFDEMKKFQ